MKKFSGLTKQGVRDLGGNNRRPKIAMAALGVEANAQFGAQMACDHKFMPVDDYIEGCKGCGASRVRIVYAK